MNFAVGIGGGMAGWLAVWEHDCSAPEPGRWARSVGAALRYGGSFVQARSSRIALGAWRRQGGEFSESGRLHESDLSTVAWVGYAVEDSGEVTKNAISSMSNPSVDNSTIAELNGAFAAVVFSASPFSVRVITDRHRHYPVYLYRGRSRIVVSTELRCVVPWLDQVELDIDAVDMLLRSGELIDRMTLIKGIDVLPPAVVFSDADGEVSERRYWSMQSRGDHNTSSRGELASILGQHLKTAVRRVDLLTERSGITLSGGLDSRIILDLTTRPEKVPSFTWGAQNCRDIVCAAAFAEEVKSPHCIRHWQPEVFPGLWMRGVDQTGGSCGIEGMFMLPFVSLLSSSCDVVLNGLAGDAILGGNWLKSAWLSESDINRLGNDVWHWRVSGADETAASRLLAIDKGAESSREKWVASLAARNGGRPIERLNDWLLENRVFRTTNCGTMLLRSGIESYSPFFDRDLIDALASTPQEFKFKHRLYLDVIKQVAPRSGSVPWQRTNIRPSWGYHANLTAMAVHRGVKVFGAFFGGEPFKALRVADPPRWLRVEWKECVESVLLGHRANSRGLFDQEAVRNMWNEHLGGIDRTRQVSVLIAIEMFSRLFIDGETPEGVVSMPMGGGR